MNEMTDKVCVRSLDAVRLPCCVAARWYACEKRLFDRDACDVVRRAASLKLENIFIVYLFIKRKKL